MSLAETAPGGATKIALTAVLLAGAATIAHLAPSPRPPYVFIDELMRDPQKYGGAELLVHGYVAPGSIVHFGATLHAYELYSHGRRVRVAHTGLLPDSFRDQTEVVERGSLVDTSKGWLLVGNEVLAKCVTKYDGNRPSLPVKFQ